MEDWMEKGLMNTENEAILNAGFIITQVYWDQQIVHALLTVPRGRLNQAV